MARTMPAEIAEARLTLLLAPDTPDTPDIPLLAPLPGLPAAVVAALMAVPAMLPGPMLPRGTAAKEALDPARGDEDLPGWLFSRGFCTVTASSCSLELRAAQTALA